jgi:hypothetical protein
MLLKDVKSTDKFLFKADFFNKDVSFFTGLIKSYQSSTALSEDGYCFSIVENDGSEHRFHSSMGEEEVTILP